MESTQILSSTNVHPDGLSGRDMLLQPALRSALTELEAIRSSALYLCAGLSDAEFNRAPGPKRWSAAQCIEHLNLSGYEMALPAVDRLIARTRERGLSPRLAYANGRISEWFIRSCDATSTRRFKTMKRFETMAFMEISETTDRFVRLQDMLIERLIGADELDLGTLKARNAAMVPMNLGQWFRFTAAHERRHLQQAGKAIEGM
jgi:hypothetical protein